MNRFFRWILMGGILIGLNGCGRFRSPPKPPIITLLTNHLDDGKCPFCSTPIAGVWSA